MNPQEIVFYGVQVYNLGFDLFLKTSKSLWSTCVLFMYDSYNFLDDFGMYVSKLV